MMLEKAYIDAIQMIKRIAIGFVMRLDSVTSTNTTSEFINWYVASIVM